MSQKPIITAHAIRNYLPSNDLKNCLQLLQDDVVYIMDKSDNQWWDSVVLDPIGNVQRGWFPASYTVTFTFTFTSSSKFKFKITFKFTFKIAVTVTFKF
ncbi:Cell division control protein 25 [Pichia kudriavzevii]|uniref:Cell division control protein 25 n=1 Tax=Pichia kudriavzevii TaxID=4909 RepID=A0A1V2LPP2_PICKU|nr:Cell division control protein 25 [Pichia kudriavzevii]